jgi:hypothetical protein
LKVRVVTSLRPGLSLESPLGAETLSELVSYILGFYEGMFAGAPVRYQSSAAEFVYDVLKQGYCLVELPEDSTAVTFHLDNHLTPCPDVKGQHARYHDLTAWRFMVNHFSMVL